MDLINEQVAHNVFGIGRVISQDIGMVSIQFSEETGIKRFLYPDAFEKYLTMCNPAVAENVLADLKHKMEQIETEKIRKQQQYEEETKREALEKAEIEVLRKKNAQKTKQSKRTKKDDSTIAASRAGDEE